MATETAELKRHPLPGFPRTQGDRYTLLTAQLVRQQREVNTLFSERLLSVREAATALGGVSCATIRAHCKKKLLRSVRVGRFGWIRIPLSSVQELLAQGAKADE